MWWKMEKWGVATIRKEGESSVQKEEGGDKGQIIPKFFDEASRNRIILYLPKTICTIHISIYVSLYTQLEGT